MLVPYWRGKAEEFVEEYNALVEVGAIRAPPVRARHGRGCPSPRRPLTPYAARRAARGAAVARGDARGGRGVPVCERRR